MNATLTNISREDFAASVRDVITSIFDGANVQTIHESIDLPAVVSHAWAHYLEWNELPSTRDIAALVSTHFWQYYLLGSKTFRADEFPAGALAYAEQRYGGRATFSPSPYERSCEDENILAGYITITGESFDTEQLEVNWFTTCRDEG